LRRYTIFLEPPGRRRSVAQAIPLTPKPPAAKLKLPTKPQVPPPPVAKEPQPAAPPQTPTPVSREELFGLPAARESAREREMKGREWRGFVQNTTAYDFREPKHWSRAVVRTQLGTQGGSGELKWKASARLDVDPVYFNSGFYPEPVKKDQRADFFLRETYIDAPLGGLQLRLGKQQIVWG